MSLKPFIPRLSYIKDSDFEDYKAWEAYMGSRAEGVIVWRSARNEMVRLGLDESGYSYAGYVPHHNISGSGFDTLNGAIKAFETDLFGNLV